MEALVSIDLCLPYLPGNKRHEHISPISFQVVTMAPWLTLWELFLPWLDIGIGTSDKEFMF
jgi:hypothetical protein